MVAEERLARDSVAAQAHLVRQCKEKVRDIEALLAPLQARLDREREGRWREWKVDMGMSMEAGRYEESIISMGGDESGSSGMGATFGGEGRGNNEDAEKVLSGLR